jgi:hypothetical protein
MMELKEFNESGALLSTYVESEGKIRRIKRRDLDDAKIKASGFSLFIYCNG